MRMRRLAHNSGKFREGRSLLQCLYATALALSVLLNVVTVSRADERTEFFETRIRPQLVKHCYECHSVASSTAEGGLKLDSRDALLAGGESGKALLSGKPEESLLIEAIRYESLEMPPSGKLSDEVIADFEKWIRDGAVDPRDRPPSADSAAKETWKAHLAERKDWWSLQPPKRSTSPTVDNDQWAGEPVDRFVLAAIRDAGLNAADPAVADVLLRRLSFVLTGLPPTPEQVASFSAATERDFEVALEELVDDFLASPHFGERMARHWMDVVRYTDTYGYEWDIPAKGSWEYRDYLIRAFNDDIGYDQLIREQIAGDLLPKPRINHEDGLNESMIGPMFYHMGEHRHGSSLAFNGIHQEMIDNKIDAFSKTFLATTIACARCHDHKLDAVSQADYYALAGVFMAPRWTARPIDSPDKHDSQIAELKRLRTQIHEALGRAWTTNRGPLASSDTLRDWAMKNRATLRASSANDVGWPFRKLLTGVRWLASKDVAAKAMIEATELTVAADGSVLASGPIPQTDSYTVTFTTEPGQASQLRLEALTHESLGSRGPGRTAHGNFVLTNIEVSVQPLPPKGSAAAKSRPIKLSSATADYSQPNYPIASALKGVAGRGWGVGLGGNVDRTAKFTFTEPVELPNCGEWTVRLEFTLGTQHVLGRFRLSVGADQASGVDETTAEDKRCSETCAKLAAEWQKTHDERAKANERFESLTDFAKPGLPEGWVFDGAGMEHGHVTAGTPLISLSGKQVVMSFLDAGYHTRSLSPKLQGALRGPAPETFKRQRVTLKLAGGE